MKGRAAPFRWHWRMAADVDVDQVSFIEIAAPLDGDHSHFDQSCPNPLEGQGIGAGTGGPSDGGL